MLVTSLTSHAHRSDTQDDGGRQTGTRDRKWVLVPSLTLLISDAQDKGSRETATRGSNWVLVASLTLEVMLLVTKEAQTQKHEAVVDW